MGRYTAGGVGRDILAGAVAGVAAIWIADKLDRAIYRAGGPASIRKTEAARPGGMDPAHVLAQRAADAAGVDLGNPQDNPGGRAVHYAIAAGMGALYGLLRGMAPGVSTGRGALYGMAMFVLKDEVGNTVLGTAGNPMAYPARDHARGAAAHTLFGIVTDLGTRLLAPWRDKVVIEEGPPLRERLDEGRAYLRQGRDDTYERGRQFLERGRGYVEEGASYAGQLAGRARSRLPGVDASGLAREGRRYAGQVADAVGLRLPSYNDAAGLIRSGRRQAGQYADNARPYLPEMPSAGLFRALQRLLG